MGLLRRESGPPHGLTFGLGVGDDLVLQGLQTGPVALAAQVHDGVMVEPCQLVEHLLFLLHGHLALHLLRSEEHTSELQSRQYLVCRLLLEKNPSLLFSHATTLTP